MDAIALVSFLWRDLYLTVGSIARTVSVDILFVVELCRRDVHLVVTVMFISMSSVQVILVMIYIISN